MRVSVATRGQLTGADREQPAEQIVDRIVTGAGPVGLAETGMRCFKPVK